MNRKQRRAKGRQSFSPAGAAEAADPIALHTAGVEAYRAGRLELAADLIAQAIAANGQIPSSHYNLAIVLRAQGKLQEAAASYHRAIQLKPDYADAHNNLGNIWKTLGEGDQARACFARALQCKPDSADAHYNLGVLYSDAQDRDQAAFHFRHCLALDPGDSRGAGMLLAQLGLTDIPQRTPQAQLLNIYEVRSRFWDQESSYFGHALVAEGLRKHAGAAKLDILDIGCGTGLLGALVRPLANRLDGVDLSPAMLEKARDKGLYDRLEQADLLAFMDGSAAPSYDAILGAAALIHFGDLKPLFEAASRALRAKGLFVFTVFPHEADGGPSDTGAGYAVASTVRLAQSGCFRHGAAYVERLAQEREFAVLALDKVIHEHDQDGKPVAGILAVLRRIR